MSDTLLSDERIAEILDLLDEPLLLTDTPYSDAGGVLGENELIYLVARRAIEMMSKSSMTAASDPKVDVLYIAIKSAFSSLGLSGQLSAIMGGQHASIISGSVGEAVEAMAGLASMGSFAGLVDAAVSDAPSIVDLCRDFPVPLITSIGKPTDWSYAPVSRTRLRALASASRSTRSSRVIGNIVHQYIQVVYQCHHVDDNVVIERDLVTEGKTGLTVPATGKKHMGRYRDVVGTVSRIAKRKRGIDQEVIDLAKRMKQGLATPRGAGRPDILNLGSSKRELYEIKPLSLIEDGRDEAETYIERLKKVKGIEPIELGYRWVPPSFFYLPGSRYFAIISIHVPGVITYEIFEGNPLSTRAPATVLVPVPAKAPAPEVVYNFTPLPKNALEAILGGVTVTVLGAMATAKKTGEFVLSRAGGLMVVNNAILYEILYGNRRDPNQG